MGGSVELLYHTPEINITLYVNYARIVNIYIYNLKYISFGIVVAKKKKKSILLSASPALIPRQPAG